MSNWYKRAQETGTPGTGGADPTIGDGAMVPNPQTMVEDATEETAWQEIDYEGLDQRIKNDILKPLYEFYNTFVNQPYPDYEGDENPFMVAMIQMYEAGTVIGFKRHLDAYANVSRLVRAGEPNPALSGWISQLLTMFPEGDAKIQLQQELQKLNEATVMQGQTV